MIKTNNNYNLELIKQNKLKQKVKNRIKSGLFTAPSIIINIDKGLFLSILYKVLKKKLKWKWFVVSLEDHKDGTPHIHICGLLRNYREVNDF